MKTATLRDELRAIAPELNWTPEVVLPQGAIAGVSAKIKSHAISVFVLADSLEFCFTFAGGRVWTSWRDRRPLNQVASSFTQHLGWFKDVIRD